MNGLIEMLSYDFMQKAFIAGILIAIVVPCIGVIVVLKRMSMIGDALSHASLAGVTAGLIAGINPIIGAAVVSTVAALAIERIRKSFSRYAEISIAVIMSCGIGLAGVLSGFVKNGASFTSFLFGSIVLISDFELWMVIILSILVIAASRLLYKELFYIAFDEEAARLAGIPVGAVNFIFILLTAITISIASRTVGVLVVSSLMVLPVAAALQIARSYKQTFCWSIGLAVLYTMIGLTLSYFYDLKPGGTIVLVGVLVLICILAYKAVVQRNINRNAMIPGDAD